MLIFDIFEPWLLYYKCAYMHFTSAKSSRYILLLLKRKIY